MKKFIFALLWCYAIQAQTFDLSCVQLQDNPYVINTYGPFNHVYENVYAQEGITNLSLELEYEKVVDSYNNNGFDFEFLKNNSIIMLVEDWHTNASHHFLNGQSLIIVKADAQYIPSFAYFVVHEYGHAYHARVLPGSFDNEEILALFNNAIWNNGSLSYYKINHREMFAVAIQRYIYNESGSSRRGILDEAYYQSDILPYLESLN